MFWNTFHVGQMTAHRAYQHTGNLEWNLVKEKKLETP